jgi:hypothetical protein
MIFILFKATKSSFMIFILNPIFIRSKQAVNEISSTIWFKKFVLNTTSHVSFKWNIIHSTRCSWDGRTMSWSNFVRPRGPSQVLFKWDCSWVLKVSYNVSFKQDLSWWSFERDCSTAFLSLVFFKAVTQFFFMLNKDGMAVQYVVLLI